jgi:hypothetical protein
METALQELLTTFNKRILELEAKKREHDDLGDKLMLQERINELRLRHKEIHDKLPKEREQIEQEVLNAIKWVEDNFYSNGNDFFTHIDTQVQYKRAELYKHYETNSNTK